MIDTKTCSGAELAPHLAAAAQWRIAVFLAFPYLHDGDAAYEADCLSTYAASPSSLFVLAFDGTRVVAASTGVPLADEVAAFRRPFVERGIAPARVFHFGEPVLLPEYRGHGAGHRFFDEREAHVRRLGGLATTAFCSVERNADDPRRPSVHRSNDAFWSKRGYVRQPGMTRALSWKEVGADAAIEHRLGFRLRPLEAAA